MGKEKRGEGGLEMRKRGEKEERFLQMAKKRLGWEDGREKRGKGSGDDEERREGRQKGW